MEPTKFVISAKYSEFETFLTDFLLDRSRNSFNELRTKKRKGNDLSKHLEYVVFGALVDFKIFIIEDGLEIVLSTSDTQNENLQYHINDVSNAINNKFFSAKPPSGFENFILDNDYVKIMQERWIESEKTQRAEAWLSTIVLLGSILEGILLYKIKANPKKANKSKSTPKKDGKPKQYKDWTLENMIVVCHEQGWISKDVKAFSDGVKEYRNFVHPWKQLENKLDMPTKETCSLSREVIAIVLDDLWKNT